jgi:ATP-binding cassette subfamily F protein 3
MPLLQMERLSVSFGAETVLEDVSFQLEPGQRVGVVGANGSGKTSLLRVVTGAVVPSKGSLTLSPRSRVAHLPQELAESPHDTVYLDALHSRPDILELREELKRLETELPSSPADRMPRLLERYGDTQQDYERLDGYAYDSRVSEVLGGVGLSLPEQQLRPEQLSGGQRRRLALARLLLQDADLLLLDEPTNHLDLEAIEWLEEFLGHNRAGMLVVSHDRRFLERLAQDILELQAGHGEWYPGGYRQYVRLRRERRALRLKEYEAQQEYIARTEEFIRRYKAGQRAREARGRQTRLDRLERLRPPAPDEQIRIKLKARKTSQVIFHSQGLRVGYGKRELLDVPAFSIDAGDRLAIVGPNGSGKTSLLKVLMGELRPLGGQVKTGPNVSMR